MKLNRSTDRWAGHDYPGVMGGGFAQFEVDELELGGRAASLISDPDQAWWEIFHERIARELEEAASGTA